MKHDRNTPLEHVVLRELKSQVLESKFSRVVQDTHRISKPLNGIKNSMDIEENVENKQYSPFTKTKRVMMAQYCSNGKNLKSLHVKHYNTWQIGLIELSLNGILRRLPQYFSY